MNGRLVTGVGNIYASEALFRARINPRRAARKLKRADCARLVRAVRATLNAAIRAGGTTSARLRRHRRRSRRFSPEALRLRARWQALPRVRHPDPQDPPGPALELLLSAMSAFVNPMHPAAHRVLNTDAVMAGLIEAVGPYGCSRVGCARPVRGVGARDRASAAAWHRGRTHPRPLRRRVRNCERFHRPAGPARRRGAQLRAVGFSDAKIAALKDLAAKAVGGIVPPLPELAAAVGPGDHRAAHRRCAASAAGRSR